MDESTAVSLVSRLVFLKAVHLVECWEMQLAGLLVGLMVVMKVFYFAANLV